MKKMLVMAAALVFVMALAGCAQSAQSSGSAASAASSTSSASTVASASSSQVTQVESDDDDDEDADDSDETPSSSKYISENEAEQIAIQEAGMGSPNDVDTDLEEGGDAPHYVVTLKSDGMVRVVEIDAVTGEVWSNQVATPPPSNSNEDDLDDADGDDVDGDVD